MRNQAQVLLKRSCTLRKLANTQIKGIALLCTGKIIFVSVAFFMALSINPNYLQRLSACEDLTLKAPITTAADDKFFNIFPNF